jgi:hypothetical protein
MSRAGSGDCSRIGITGSHSHTVLDAGSVGSLQAGAIHQRAIIAQAKKNSRTYGSVTGASICGLVDIFCATVGAVDEETIKAYIENKSGMKIIRANK